MIRLPRATPESQGIPSAVIGHFIAAVERDLRDLHSVMLLRHGRVIAEGWWSPYAADTPHMLFSLSKSFTSTAVGLAIDEGRLTLDDPVIGFFPTAAAAAAPDPHLAALRVRHLLAMCTGHTEDTTPHMVTRADGDWIAGFFSVPLVHEPGTHFLYNTGATYMLAAILAQVTNAKLVDYLRPRLFDPLGIAHPIWEESPAGIAVGGWGLNITTEDIAAFGQLYLQRGLWAGRQLIPAAWVEEATRFQISNASDPATDPVSDWAQGYGYQFWRCRHNAYRGDGAFGQYCVILPEQDVVLAMTGGLADMQPPLNLVWDILLPALGDHPLPADPLAHDALRRKLSGLHLAPLRAEAALSLPADVSGRMYSLNPNPLGLTQLSVRWDERSAVLTLTSGVHGADQIAVGYGEWAFGHTRVFPLAFLNAPPAFSSIGIAASGAWTQPDTFTIAVRLYETPFVYTLQVQFAGDTVQVEGTVNVSFMPITPLTLTGQVG